jgi:hypothetical protein
MLTAPAEEKRGFDAQELQMVAILERTKDPFGAVVVCIS